MRIRSKGIFQFLAPVVAVPAPLRAYGFTSLALIGDQGSGRRKEKTEGGNPHLRTGLAALIQRRQCYFDVCRPRNQDTLDAESLIIKHPNLFKTYHLKYLIL